MARSSITFELFQAPTCPELLEKLAAGFAACDSSNSTLSAFLLFWGPPGGYEQDIRRLLNVLPRNCPAIGCSREHDFGNTEIIATDPASRAWTATLVRSEYIEAKGAYAKLSTDSDGNLEVHRTMQEFKSCLDHDYFNGGQPHHAEKKAPHGVRYRRPAVLLLFLPGMGGDLNHPWPVSNHDYEIVEALSADVSHSVGVFGASAVSHWPASRKNASIPDSWVAHLTADSPASAEASTVLVNGFVGLLVKTDLAFGLATEHGFKLSDDAKERFIVHEGDPATRAPALIYPQSWPDRFHSVRLSDSGTAPTLPNPTDSSHLATRLTTPHDTTRMLFQCELNELIPNPAYSLDANDRQHLSFLRAMANGTPLYGAAASRDDVVGSAGKAAARACKYGDIHDVKGVFVSNCRGRLYMLGENEAPQLESAALSRCLPDSASIFGLYSDGEACSSPSGRPLHRNWTVATLVWGAEFNPRYSVAARVHLLASLARDAALTHSPDQMLQKVIDVALILLQTDCCHIWTLSSDGTKLEQKCGKGTLSDIVPCSFSLDRESPDSCLTAYRAFHSNEVCHRDMRAYLDEIDFRTWRASESVCREHVQKYDLILSVPIVESRECLGVISIGIPFGRLGCPSELNSAAESPSEEIRALLRRVDDLAAMLASTAALPIRAALMNASLTSTLIRVAEANDERSLALSILSEGQRLIHRDVHLSLMLPDSSGRQLVCRGCHPPLPDTDIDPRPCETFRVSIEKETSPGSQGICGWVFMRKDVWKNPKDEADGVDGRPLYAPFLRQAKANYAVPILDSTETRCLGVINAESANVEALSPDLHVRVLKSLAKACSAALLKYERQDSLWRHLSQLLPSHIVKAMKEQEHVELSSLRAPRPSVVTTLYADIRGYTEISEVVGETRIARFIAEYYSMLASAIAESRGTLDKFMGDGVLALYGDVIPVDSIANSDKCDESVGDAAKQAIRCGLKIGETFASLADKWLKMWRRECPRLCSDHTLEIGILVHTGKPLVGLFHGEAGNTSARVTYTAIGRDINLASRLGGDLRSNQVWVTASTWQILQDTKHPFDIPGETQKVKDPKGISGTFELFRIAGGHVVK